MDLHILDYNFTVCKVADASNIDFVGEFIFVSKTDDEISLVCKSDCVPANVTAMESGWRALKIAGVLDFGMVGVIAKITGLLAQAGISVFVVSTYNTDYIFLKADNFENSIRILIENGYTI